MSVTYGIHAVTQVIDAGRAAEHLLVLRGKKGTAIDKVIRAAKQADIPVRFVTKSELDRAADFGVHQGVALISGGKRFIDLEDLLAQVAEKKSALLVLLDGVQDPHNLGAILRTAVCAGADGVILPERRSAGITPAAEKAAAGAADHIAVARVINLNRAIEEIQAAGFWLVGLDAAGDKSLREVDMTGRVGLVLGGEGKGLHQQVRKHCDFVASIPVLGPVESLNVSVAAGVALYEALRQRQAIS